MIVPNGFIYETQKYLAYMVFLNIFRAKDNNAKFGCDLPVFASHRVLVRGILGSRMALYYQRFPWKLL